MSARPAYAELPDGCAWDILDGELGSLALLTPERAVAAAGLVRSGLRYPLDLRLDVPDPPFFGREPMRREVFPLLHNVLDDRLDNFFPQASTQWDGFGHFGHSTRGFFGGQSMDDVQSSDVGLLAWTEQGIVGRGVLLDVARRVDIPGGEPFVVTVDMLRETADAQNVELREGDVLCVRVGWLGWYRAQPVEVRTELAEASKSYVDLNTPGIGPGPTIAEYLWDHGVAAIAVDNPGIEPFPMTAALPEGATIDDTVHVRVMAMLGIPLGEFFDLDPLADACAADGVYEFLFTSAPLRIPGGIGSPPNALAIR
jgi:kynurenine formamidase